jgi:hypothetical protein
MWGRLHAAVHLGQLLELEPAQVEEMITAIIAAEGFTVDAVRTGIDTVLGLDRARLLADLRSDDILRPAVDALLALLNSDRKTRPRVPDGVATAGKWISALMARKPGAIGLGRRMARSAAWGFRRFVWGKLH